jgi:hypothetical protein
VSQEKSVVDAAGVTAVPPAGRTIPVAIQRLMDEVRGKQPTPSGLFDRAHNRHNRSCSGDPQAAEPARDAAAARAAVTPNPSGTPGEI